MSFPLDYVAFHVYGRDRTQGVEKTEKPTCLNGGGIGLRRRRGLRLLEIVPGEKRTEIELRGRGELLLVEKRGRAFIMGTT